MRWLAALDGQDGDPSATVNLLVGWYALHVSLPLSGISRKLRRFSRRIRGREKHGLQEVGLAVVSWKRLAATRRVPIFEFRKANANVRLGELAVINALASQVRDGADIFEIGTFDGRTTLNLALASPPQCIVHTLDLPQGVQAAMELEGRELHMVDKSGSGARIDAWRDAGITDVSKIRQWLGDSARFDFSAFDGSCGLVFVDGSHAYEYVHSDVRAAARMLEPGGVLLCHDYGIWPGVTTALEELSGGALAGIRCIDATSLAYWRKPGATQ